MCDSIGPLRRADTLPPAGDGLMVTPLIFATPFLLPTSVAAEADSRSPPVRGDD